MQRSSLTRPIAALTIGLTALSTPLAAQPAQPYTPPSTLTVATRIVPPFVMQQDGRLTGFSTELWESIAKLLKVKSQITPHDSVADLLNAVRTKQADVGIAAISITSERDKSNDFSQPIYDAGLQILVRDENSNDGSPDIISMIFSKQLLQLILQRHRQSDVVGHLDAGHPG